MNRCCKKMPIRKSSPETYQCSNSGMFEIDGKFYCGVHAPNKKSEVARLKEVNAELLEALKDLREAIKSRGVISTVKALKKTDAAIAKAEGGAL